MRGMRDLIIYSVDSLETTGDLASSGDTYRTPTRITFLSWSTQTREVPRIRMKSLSVSVFNHLVLFSALDAVNDCCARADHTLTAVRNCDVSFP